MKTTVDLQSLSFVAKIADQFGLPTVQDVGYNELVGPYSVEDDSGFLEYCAATRTWSKVEETLRGPDAMDVFDGMTADERDEVWTLMNMAALAPPAFFPSDKSEPTVLDPFIYQGRLLGWVFVPELKRWELAPYHKA